MQGARHVLETKEQDVKEVPLSIEDPKAKCDIPKILAIKDRFSFMLLNIFRVNPFDLKELRNLFPKTKHDKTLFTEAFHKRNVFSL